MMVSPFSLGNRGAKKELIEARVDYLIFVLTPDRIHLRKYRETGISPIE
jgi:hypothetical protein